MRIRVPTRADFSHLKAKEGAPFMNLTVILVIILTTVLFVLNYRMLQMKKRT